MELHPSALKHGIGAEDIEHAIVYAMVIEDLEDETRLYLGPRRDAVLLEVVTVVRRNQPDLVIHAMAMRRKYRRLLQGA